MIPIMLVTYMVAFMDRTNISFAIPTMAKDLHLTSTQLGFASGVLFLFYAASQPLGGMIADRGYGKPMVAILMILWGLSEVAQGFIQTPTQLIIVRSLLGLFEGGLMVTFLLIVCNWFTVRERGRANGLWFLSFPVAAMISGPIAGYILHLSSWRILFISEGVLPIIWSVVWIWGISAKPSQAKWLTEGERRELLQKLDAEHRENTPHLHEEAPGLWQQMFRLPVIIYTLALFLWNFSFVGFIIWLPSILHQDKSLNAVSIGWLSSLPFLVAVFVMLFLAWGSDKFHSRRMFAAVPIGLSGLIFVIAAHGYATNSLATNLGLLVVAGSMLYGAQPMIYAIPGDLVPTRVVATVIGIANGIGVVGDFLGPYVLGYVRQLAGDFSAGIFLLGAALIVSCVLLVFVRDRTSRAHVQATAEGHARLA
jgi:sugar phosphate permease